MRGAAEGTGPGNRKRLWGLALTGLFLAVAGPASSWAETAGGISCPSGTNAPQRGKESDMEAIRSTHLTQRTVAPIDEVRPDRTEVATFALG